MIDCPVILNPNWTHEAVIMQKGELFAVLALTTATTNDRKYIILGRTDPRSNTPNGITHSEQDTLETGKQNFENALRHSLDNGWRLAWRGFPYGGTH